MLRTRKDHRRNFVKKLLGSTAGIITMPPILAAKGPSKFPTYEEWRQEEEGYWQLVKSQYPIHPDLVMMNAGNFCPAPYPVSTAMKEHLESLNRDASSQDREKYKHTYTQAKEQIAGYLGAGTDEIAITRNTSEGNNIINTGLDLKPGDEVIYWDQNHQTLNIAWEVRAKRVGFKIVKVSTPSAPKTGEDLVAPFLEAMTKRTRLICFSHISNISGTLLPAKEICALARERGILSLVDGAQSFGLLAMDLHTLGCDFYTGSSHKWLTGPKESGVLYARTEVLPKLWPSVISKGWIWENEWKIENLTCYGQRNDATVAAFGKTIEFHQTIGKEKVEARVKTLVDYLKQQMLAEIPGITFVTPAHRDDMYAGILVFNLPGVDPDAAVAKLYSTHRIAAAATHDGYNGIRLSPNIYNTKSEIDRVVDVLKQLKA